MAFEQQKREAAAAALREVRSGMLLGLGTGSTAAVFVELLADAIDSGTLHDIRGVCTSTATDALARRRGIATVSFNDITQPIDLAVDGADEVDESLRLIKGRGGALLREKIVEQAAREFIVIVDESKLVARLGEGSLPVEVVRFSSQHLLRRFAAEGFAPVLRQAEGTTLITDEGHHIIDVSVGAGEDIATVVERMRSIAGVVDTGFFPTEASRVLVAGVDGVREMRRG